MTWPHSTNTLTRPERLDEKSAYHAMLASMGSTAAQTLRHVRVKVSLSLAERAAIEERAAATGRSLSGLLRELGLGFEPKSTRDLEAVQQLVKVNADQGRLGGLLKLWLTNWPGEGAPTLDVRRLLKEIEETQGELRRLVQRL